MSDKNTETASPFGEGPDLEDIAALIDGRLAGAERARVVARLAEDEASYEVFSEVLRLQEEEQPAEGPVAVEPANARGEVVPFDHRSRRGPSGSGWRRWLPAAAMLAAALSAVVIGSLLRDPSRDARSLTVASLRNAAPSTGLDDWYGEGKITLRGEGVTGATDNKVDFQLGVQVVDLHVALATNDLGHARTALQRQLNLLNNDDRALYLEGARYERLLEMLEQGPDAAVLRAEAATGERELEESVGGLYFDFGRWVEAARLAAEVGEVDFFTHRRTRRMLQRLERAGLEKTSELLRQICANAVADRAAPGALRKVRQDLDKIARQYSA